MHNVTGFKVFTHDLRPPIGPQRARMGGRSVRAPATNGFYAGCLLTARGLHWVCYDSRRVVQIFVGDDGEQRAREYAEMTERSDVTAHAAK